MVQAADTLFGESANTITLSSGRTLTIQPAKMKHMSLVVSMFTKIATSLDPKQINAVVDVVAGMQAKAIAEGRDPRAIDVTDLQQPGVLEAALGNLSLLDTLMSGALDMMPVLATAFAGIPKAEYEELEADDGLKLIGAIFVVNYDFFTERLPPILTGFIRSLASRKEALQNRSANQNRKKHPGTN